MGSRFEICTIVVPKSGLAKELEGVQIFPTM